MECKILAHRGYREKFPENTLLGFKKALEFGADGIECDIQKTGDNKYVIIHDDTINRIAGIKSDEAIRVCEKKLDELKTYNIGSGESIATLEQLLGIMPDNKIINLELKMETLTKEDCPEIFRVVSAYNKNNNFMVSSFAPDLLYYFTKKKFSVGFLIGEKTIEMGFWTLFKTIIKIKPEYINIPIQIFNITGSFVAVLIIRLLRILKFKIAFWTINSVNDLKKIIRFADIIITDRVEFILENLKK